MANELSVYYPIPSLTTVYFVVTTQSSRAWNGAAFEAQTSPDWASYAIPGVDSAGTGNYLANFPGGIAAGTVVSLFAYREAGGPAASTDTLIGTQLDVTWDGTALASGGGGLGNGLVGGGTTHAQARDSTLWGTTDRLIAANPLSAGVQVCLRMPRQGQAQQFWDGFEQLATSYFGGVPVDAAEALARLADYSMALNAQAQVAREIVALAVANPGTLHTTIDATGTAFNTVRIFS